MGNHKKPVVPISVPAVVLNRLEFYNSVYLDPRFEALVNSFKKFSNWSDVQQGLSMFKKNKVRGHAYEEIARAILMTHPDFKGAYKSIFFSHYPGKLLTDLNIEEGDFGIDAVGETLDGDYHAFQMKHKVDPNKRVYWSTDKLSNFYGDADKAHKLILMTNAVGPCGHMKKKAGGRLKEFSAERHHDIRASELVAIGDFLNERFKRFDKLRLYNQRLAEEVELKSLGVGLFRKLREKFPLWRIEFEEKTVKRRLYQVNGVPVLVPDYPEKDSIGVEFRWSFDVYGLGQNSSIRDALEDVGFEEGTYPLEDLYSEPFDSGHRHHVSFLLDLDDTEEAGQIDLSVTWRLSRSRTSKRRREREKEVLLAARNLEKQILKFFKVAEKRFEFSPLDEARFVYPWS